MNIKRGVFIMKNALIVIDYQNDFVDGSLGFPKAKELELPIVKKINEYRQNGDDVLFTFDSHEDDYLQTKEGLYLPIVHCTKNSDGWKLYGEVAKAMNDSDKCFYKSSYGSSELFLYLNSNRYDSIELVGLVSNICVISNAILAQTASPDSEIIIDANCIASNSEELNAASLSIMEGMHMKILNKK